MRPYTIKPNDKSLIQIRRIFGKDGTITDNVLKFTFPRYDLTVNVGNVIVEPALALTSWTAFHFKGNSTMMMGDLVLLENELYIVTMKLMEFGIKVTALHNHLVAETPKIMYLHVEGIGDPVSIANGVKNALSLTSTPIWDYTPQNQIPFDWTTVESSFGLTGQKQGRVLMLSIPRHKPVFHNGTEIPPAMGLNHVINIQAEGQKIASTGDFVLQPSQVNPVIRVLTLNQIVTTAIHNHMLNESPRLFFLHFWALGELNMIISGLKSALEKTKIIV